jgi:hypothetical protein
MPGPLSVPTREEGVCADAATGCGFAVSAVTPTLPAAAFCVRDVADLSRRALSLPDRGRFYTFKENHIHDVLLPLESA